MVFEKELLDDETIDDLQYKGLIIIQKKNSFRFGIDAVLLSDFVETTDNQKSIIDLGTGNGIIPILLSGKTKIKNIVGLEIQEDIASLAKRNVELNNLTDRIKIICGDIKCLPEELKKKTFDIVVTNPPYIKTGCGLLNNLDNKTISRHEVMCTLDDIVRTASKLLSFGGQFIMIHRPNRLVDILITMRSYKIEPKYIKFVHPKPNKSPNLLLIRGLKGGNPELKILDSIYMTL